MVDGIEGNLYIFYDKQDIISRFFRLYIYIVEGKKNKKEGALTSSHLN